MKDRSIRARLAIVGLFAVSALVPQVASQLCAAEQGTKAPGTIDTIAGSGSPTDNGPAAGPLCTYQSTVRPGVWAGSRSVHLRARSAPHPPLGPADKRVIHLRRNRRRGLRRGWRSRDNGEVVGTARVALRSRRQLVLDRHEKSCHPSRRAKYRYHFDVRRHWRRSGL